MPWEHWWVWQNPAEREHYASALRRVQRAPLLRGAVVFDDAGPDVAAWLRRVGFMLSTSDDESFHVAPAEGMASRAVPVVRHWPGAETIYDRRWIHRDPADMAAAIAALSDEADWRRAGDEAHAQAAAAFNLQRVCEAWYSLLTTDIDPAVAGPRARAARLRLTEHVLHARGQRVHPREVRGAGQRGDRHRPAGDADPRPAGRGLAGAVRAGGRGALGQPARTPARRAGRTRAPSGPTRRGCMRAPG